jgi:hypothetical protein
MSSKNPHDAASGLEPRPPLLEPVVGEDQERDHGRGGEQKEDAHSSVQSLRLVIALQRPTKESGANVLDAPRRKREEFWKNV